MREQQVDLRINRIGLACGMGLVLLGIWGLQSRQTPSLVEDDPAYTQQVIAALASDQQRSSINRHESKSKHTKNLHKQVEILYINLPQHEDRKQALETSLAARGLSARRFAAVEGRRLDMRMMLANGVIDDKMFLALQPQSAWSWEKKANKFSRGQIGCMLSHISLWMQNSAQEKPYILVLEDDVQLPDNFTEVLRQIVDQIATTDFDIVQLSGVDDVRLCQQKKFKFMHKRLCQGQIDPRRTLQAQAYIQPARFSPGAWAYLIKVDQIPKILKHFSQPLLAKPTSIPENKSMAYWAPLDMVIWLLEDIRIGTWYPYVINREQTISFNEGNSATAN